MSYTKFHEAWENDPSTDTPITAEALDHIEEGIERAHDVRGAYHDTTGWNIAGATAADLTYPVAAGDAALLSTRFSGASSGIVRSISAPPYGEGARMIIRNVNVAGGDSATLQYLAAGGSTFFYMKGGQDLGMAFDDHAEFVYENGYWILVNQDHADDIVALEASIIPWQMALSPLASEPQATAFATIDTRNAHPVLDFDASSNEYTAWTGVLPSGYAGGGVNVKIIWTATSATSGNVVWEAGFERIPSSGLDIDADSWATGVSATAAADPVSGETVETTIALSHGAQMDSLAAGELFRFYLQRTAASGSDTMTGDAEVLMVFITEQ